MLVSLTRDSTFLNAYGSSRQSDLRTAGKDACNPRRLVDRLAGLSQWQISHWTFPLALEAAFDDQEQVVDGAADGQRVQHLEHARHPLAGSDTLIRVLAQRGYVVGDEQAALLSSPFENGRIACSRESHVLDPDDVNVRLPTNQST